MSRELEPIAPDIAALLDAERRLEGEPPARMDRVLVKVPNTGSNEVIRVLDKLRRC